MRSFHFGLLQYTMQEGPQKTGQHVLKKLENNFKKSDLDFVVLPEMWLGGPTSQSERKTWLEIYQKGTENLCALASKYRKSILASQFSFEKGHYYNSAIFINSRGKLAQTYHKIHLFTHGGENKLFSLPKTKATKFSYKGLNIGQIVCYDVRFPELARDLAHQGIHVLVVQAQWPVSRRDHWITLLKARAIENQIFVVAVNRLGLKRNEIFGGDSMVIDPWGQIQLSLPANREWGTTVIDLSLMDKIRREYPFFKERRLKGIRWS